MASLTLTIGALTASVSADNTKAPNLLNAYADAIGATGTNQQKANTVVESLVRHMREHAHMVRKNEVTVQAIASIASELSALSWEA
jgi:hypothetical protein